MMDYRINDIDLADAIGEAPWRFAPYHGFSHRHILNSVIPELCHELDRRVEGAGIWGYFFRIEV